MKKLLISFAILIVIFSLLMGVYYLFSPKISSIEESSSETSVSENDSDCSDTESPVCGTDGVTYKNSCIAEFSGALIDHQGSCSSPTIMTDVERKYLLWLLRERDINGLDNLSIKHFKTYVPDCDGCYTIYYSWNDGNIKARIEVKNDSVVSAIDTTGYDILNNVYDQPIEFTELNL